MFLVSVQSNGCRTKGLSSGSVDVVSISAGLHKRPIAEMFTEPILVPRLDQTPSGLLPVSPSSYRRIRLGQTNLKYNAPLKWPSDRSLAAEFPGRFAYDARNSPDVTRMISGCYCSERLGGRAGGCWVICPWNKFRLNVSGRGPLPGAHSLHKSSMQMRSQPPPRW